MMMQRSGGQILFAVLFGGMAFMGTTFPTIAAEKADSTEPAVVLVLGPGQATATPLRQGSARTGGGNIHVTQPAPDTISVTMTGVAVAKPHPCNDSVASFAFDLSQCFEVVFNDPKVKGAKLVMWGRSVGFLRSECHCCPKCGAAEITTPGHATVNCGAVSILALALPPRAVACGENISIHDREGPVWGPVMAGKYTLHQAFDITASHRKGIIGKPACAEFAPDPALEADWISKREPFHGAAKKDLGFQVILKVIADYESDGKKDNHNGPK